MTSARAIATRCCCPPDSWFGWCSQPVAEADGLERRDRARFAALARPSRRRTAAAARRSRARVVRGSRLKPWNTKPISRLRTRGELARSTVATRRAVEQVAAARRTVEAAEQVHERRLARPDGPVSATNSPRHDVQRHAAQRVHVHVAERVGLASGPGRKSAASLMASAAHRRCVRLPPRPRVGGSERRARPALRAAVAPAMPVTTASALGERTGENGRRGAVRDAGADAARAQPAVAEHPHVGARRRRLAARPQPSWPRAFAVGRPGAAPAPAVPSAASDLGGRPHPQRARSGRAARRRRARSRPSRSPSCPASASGPGSARR